MTNAQIETFKDTVKEVAVQMIKAGYTGNQVATAIGSKFGNAIARLIMVDIAIDNGMIEQSKRYLARF